jgi:predicted RNA-binding protein (virulence factor B family)
MSTESHGIGIYNDLQVNRLTIHGAFLQFAEKEVLLPKKFVEDHLKPGDIIRVFVYTDSEDRLVATTQEPKGVLNEFVGLEVVDVLPFGAFLDWGLDKHLFVPNNEMDSLMAVGEVHVVKIVLDYQTNRLIGVGKIGAFVKPATDLEAQEKVRGIVAKRTDLGYKVLVDDRFSGLLYHNEVFVPLSVGDRITCFVKQVREDGRLDLILRLPGRETIDDDAAMILQKLKENDGILELSDKSDAGDIKNELGLSKKAFKKAIGSLYKLKLISISPNRVKLL